MKFNFLLKAEPRRSLDEKVVDEVEIGKLNLIVDHNLELIDENWFIDVDSPWVVAKPKKDVYQAVTEMIAGLRASRETVRS